jgi:ATP-binding protein involved in chromosome partitioning
MSTEIKNIVNTLINPNTGKTLIEEGRIVDIKAEATEFLLKYKRDGISPEQKKVIENSLYEKLASIYKPEQVTILTISENSNDIFQRKPEATSTAKPNENAQLKAGHGPVGANKKRVAGVKKVIAVSSCKGGVGKSTVSVNLAFALKNLGKKVAILDADIYGPSMPMLLNKRDAKPSANDQKKILPIEAYGLSFISFGLFIGEKDPVIWRGPMLGGVLNQFLFDVDWTEGKGELDYLIIEKQCLMKLNR